MWVSLVVVGLVFCNFLKDAVYCSPYAVIFATKGDVIARGEQDRSWKAREWGYLILLYILLTLIRYGLFASAYPITSRIGLKTNWKETSFQVYGGLRGAVGVSYWNRLFSCWYLVLSYQCCFIQSRRLHRSLTFATFVNRLLSLLHWITKYERLPVTRRTNSSMCRKRNWFSHL